MDFEDCDVPEELPTIHSKMGSSKTCHASFLSLNKGGLKEENKQEFLQDLEIEYTNRSLSPIKHRRRLLQSDKEVSVFEIIRKKSKTVHRKRSISKVKRKKLHLGALKKRSISKSTKSNARTKAKTSSKTVSSGDSGLNKMKSKKCFLNRKYTITPISVNTDMKEIQITMEDISPAY